MGDATDLVKPGGSGTADDAAVVAIEAGKLPDPVLDLFRSKGIAIVACRQSITDFEISLRGVVPRGWEGLGKTWDSVPGTYLDDRKSVIIATIANGTQRIVPTRDSGLHGAWNLVVHESMHGYDYTGKHAALQDPRFVNARQADYTRLDPYEQQAGQAGLEESYAESASRYYGGDPGMAAGWPMLFGFWQTVFSGEEAVVGPPVPLPPRRRDGPIGTIHVTADAIHLDLRAEGPRGAIGHAMLRFPAGHPTHAKLVAHLAGAGEESVVSSERMLFRPLPKQG